MMPGFRRSRVTRCRDSRPINRVRAVIFYLGLFLVYQLVFLTLLIKLSFNIKRHQCPRCKKEIPLHERRKFISQLLRPVARPCMHCSTVLRYPQFPFYTLIFVVFLITIVAVKIWIVSGFGYDSVVYSRFIRVTLYLIMAFSLAILISLDRLRFKEAESVPGREG